jgi:hypothetical protein
MAMPPRWASDRLLSLRTREYLRQQGAQVMVPCQYLGSWLLDSGGTVRYDFSSGVRRRGLPFRDCPFGHR